MTDFGQYFPLPNGCFAPETCRSNGLFRCVRDSGGQPSRDPMNTAPRLTVAGSVWALISRKVAALINTQVPCPKFGCRVKRALQKIKQCLLRHFRAPYGFEGKYKFT